MIYYVQSAFEWWVKATLIYIVIIERFTLSEWLKKMEQNSLNGSVPARLDIGVHKQFWTRDILLIIDLRTMGQNIFIS